jgi:hypothetical protein
MFPTLVAALALSAPVPKITPKLADLFGEPTAAKGDCTLELNKDGSLAATVPPTHPKCDGSLAGSLHPLAAKTVRADFVLTVKLTVDVPDDASSNRRPDQLLTCAAGGIAVRSVANPELGLVAAAERSPGRKGWSMCRRISGCEQTGDGNYKIHGRTTDGGTGTECYLKLSRQGAKLTAEWSADGAKWKDGYVWKITGLEDDVTVGPVAYQSTDKPLVATFDEYQLKLVEK